MQKSGKFDEESNPQSEETEIGVNVVKHTERSINLSIQLSNHTSEEDHSKSIFEEDVHDPVREPPEISILGSSRDIYGKNNEDNHKLTSEKVAVEVISLMTKLGTFVSDGVGILVKLGVDGCKSDEGSLSSLNHGKPEDSNPDSNVCNGRVCILGKSGHLLCNKSHDTDDGEDQGDRRVDLLEKS
jgi:hypothetical protein